MHEQMCMRVEGGVRHRGRFWRPWGRECYVTLTPQNRASLVAHAHCCPALRAVSEVFWVSFASLGTGVATPCCPAKGSWPK